jgi:hypothetical protein
MLGLLVTVGAILGDPAPVEDINQAATTAPRVTQAPDAEPATTARPTSTQRQTDLNKPVRDGSFEFVVTAFRCRADECRATMTVENIGNDPGTMFADNQYLFDTQGRKFEADSSLTDSLLFEELNPGRMVRGTIRWKVSEGFKADYLELHDSAFSGGVEVKVS